MQMLNESQIKEELIRKGAKEAKAIEIASFANGNLGYAINILNDKKVLGKYDEYKEVFFGMENNKIDTFSFYGQKKRRN